MKPLNEWPRCGRLHMKRGWPIGILTLSKGKDICGTEWVKPCSSANGPSTPAGDLTVAFQWSPFTPKD